MQVQKLRLKRGWSQQQLAELSGLSVRTIQRIEGGQAASTETLKSLASVFEIDFSELTSEADMPVQQTLSSPIAPSLDEQLAFKHVRRLRSFYAGLAIYVVVICALCAVNYLNTPQRIWVVWPALGWGLALLIRAARVFEWVPFMGADWEKAQVEKRLGRPL